MAQPTKDDTVCPDLSEYCPDLWITLKISILQLSCLSLILHKTLSLNMSAFCPDSFMAGPSCCPIGG